MVVAEPSRHGGRLPPRRHEELRPGDSPRLHRSRHSRLGHGPAQALLHVVGGGAAQSHPECRHGRYFPHLRRGLPRFAVALAELQPLDQFQSGGRCLVEKLSERIGAEYHGKNRGLRRAFLAAGRPSLRWLQPLRGGGQRSGASRQSIPRPAQQHPQSPAHELPGFWRLALHPDGHAGLPHREPRGQRERYVELPRHRLRTEHHLQSLAELARRIDGKRKQQCARHPPHVARPLSQQRRTLRGSRNLAKIRQRTPQGGGRPALRLLRSQSGRSGRPQQSRSRRPPHRATDRHRGTFLPGRTRHRGHHDQPQRPLCVQRTHHSRIPERGSAEGLVRRR